MKKILMMSVVAGLICGVHSFNVHAQKKDKDTQVFKIDESHTALVFKINHLGFSHAYGQFAKVDGEFHVNDKNPSQNKINVVIDADSVNTHNAKRDDHLRKPDFFDVKQYPKITFMSTKVEKKKNNEFMVTGDLTMHGKTKSISFPFQQSRVGKDPWGKTRTGGDAQFVVKRSDFGMNYMQGENQLGDEVAMFLSVEGILQ